VVVCLVAVVVYSLHGFRGYLDRDVALYAYGGQQVVDGVPPYVGVLNRAGPLAHILPGIGVAVARLVGADDLTSIRVVFMLFAVACVGVVYLATRDVFRSRLAGVAAAAAFLSFTGFVHYATYGPREKTPMTLFLALCLWAVCRRRWLWAGVALGLATLTLQIAFFVGAPAVVVGALLANPDWRSRALALGRAAVGGLATLVLMVTYFALSRALYDFAEGYLLLNARYPSRGSLASTPGEAWHRVVEGYGASTWVLVGGLVALVPLTWWAFRGRGKDGMPSAATLAATTAGAAGGVVWSVVGDFDRFPDAYPLLPFAAIGVGGVMFVLARRLPQRAAVAVVAVASLVAASYATAHSVRTRDTGLDEQRALVDDSLAVVGDDARILSVWAPQAMVLSGQRNATRHQTFGGGLSRYVEDTWPGGMAGLVREEFATKPTFVATMPWPTRRWTDALDPDYVRVGCAPLLGLYARRSLGDSVIARLEDRLADCPPFRKRFGGDPGAP
jgi:hypothetical protein